MSIASLSRGFIYGSEISRQNLFFRQCGTAPGLCIPGTYCMQPFSTVAGTNELQISTMRISSTSPSVDLWTDSV